MIVKGCVLNGKQDYWHKYNEDLKKMIADLYNSGSSAKDLSNEYGVNYICVD